MKSIVLVVFTLLIIVFSAKAEDVYFTSGLVYKNVKIDTTGAIAIITFGVNNTEWQQKASILRIEQSTFIPVNKEKPQQLRYSSTTSNVETEKYSNIKYLAIGILGAGLAWNNFSDASDYSDAIDVLKSINSHADVSKMENSRTRVYLVGAVSAIVGVVFTVYALTPVTVSVSPNGFNATLKF